VLFRPPLTALFVLVDFAGSVVLCKFLVNMLFVVLRLGDDGPEEEDETPESLGDITDGFLNFDNRPERKSGTDGKPPPRPKPPKPFPWQKQDSDESDDKPDAESNAETDETSRVEEIDDDKESGDTQADEPKVVVEDVSESTEQSGVETEKGSEPPAAEPETVELTPVERALALQHSQLWECSFSGCSNHERDSGGAVKFAGCAKCKRVAKWTPYCARQCQAKDWATHKLVCGTE
jgi:MYND finger